MRHVSWRYSELKILESWEFPVLCFTGGKIDMSAMVEMDSIPSGRRLARDVLTTCRSRTNKRSWPLPCRILPVAPGSTLSNWLDSDVICRPAPSTVRCVVWDWARDRSGLSSSNDTAHREAGLLTERTRGELQRARQQRRHVQASEPGELVCLDTFYIGRLKGVGKVWQITACDAACSYAAARIIPANTAEHAVRFLVEILLPLYEAAGWPLQRVLTDRGSEFKGDFDAACDNLSIRHTRTKPRHAWTNGFVERLQGIILHQHWRVAFRRRYFTTRSQLDRSLQRYLAFYNDERAHQGYRTKGRTPSTLFWGAADNILQGGD